MAVRNWFTVFAVYDDNEQPYIEFVEAKDKQEARSKALRKADGVILIAGIAPGKVEDADVEGLDNVVPIRGKEHAIEVTHVRITKRKVVLPGHCPACRHDFRRARSIAESFLMPALWPAHLSHNGKDLTHERDAHQVRDGAVIPLVTLSCGNCGHKIWEGMHGD